MSDINCDVIMCGKQVALSPANPYSGLCQGCVAEFDEELCEALPDCGNLEQSVGAHIFVVVRYH